MRDLGTGLWLHRQAYITVWIEETPASIGKEPLRVIVNSLHDFGPVQVLQSLSVFDVTRAGREKWREKERESGKKGEKGRRKNERRGRGGEKEGREGRGEGRQGGEGRGKVGRGGGREE